MSVTFTNAWRTGLCAAAALALSMAALPAQAQNANMTFFVTSHGIGNGGNLGGLAGADNWCQQLAQEAGAGGKTWHAYLSTQAEDGKPAGNAKDRIGKGPWQNAKGEVITKDVAELHGDNKLTKQTALSEKGEVINGRGDKPNRHDMLTGSKPDGTRIADQTCGDWTMSGAEGAAMMGHHDRTGLDDSAAAKSWNSSHTSRGGCSQEALKGTGGDGLFYCFAVE